MTENVNTTNLFSEEELKLIMEIKETAKSISSCLSGKFGQGLIIAGGCFTSWIQGEKPNDIDIFITEDTPKNTLVELDVFRQTFPDKIITSPYDGATINDRITDKPFSIRPAVFQFMIEGLKALQESHRFQLLPDVQIIRTSYANRRDLISHFDFLHTCVSYDMDNDKLFISKNTLEAIQKKCLVPNGDNRPRSWRYEKFINRGWTRSRSLAQLLPSPPSQGIGLAAPPARMSGDEIASQLAKGIAGHVLPLPPEAYKTVGEWKATDDWSDNFPTDWKSKWPISSF
jgi:hypothetical protein